MLLNRSVVLTQALGIFYSKPCGLTDKLGNGTMTGHQFRDVVLRDCNEIEDKLKTDSNANLAASVGLFKEGVMSLFQWMATEEWGGFDFGSGVIRMTEDEDDDYDFIELYADRSKGVQSLLPEKKSDEVVSDGATAAKKQSNYWEEISLNFFRDSREKFKDAREEYSKVLGHTSLGTRDKITLIKTQIAAALLANLKRPSDCLEMCRIFLGELHALPAVRQVFSNVVLFKDINSLINDNYQTNIFTSICQVNHAIFTVTLAFNPRLWDFSSCVMTIDECLHPLHDTRLVRKLHALGLGEWDVTWTFGHSGSRAEHKLVEPWDIAVDREGRFMVADWGGNGVKVFDSHGSYLYSLCVSESELTFSPCSVATDDENNVYVLAVLEDDAGQQSQNVYVFDKHANLSHKFPLPQRDEFESWSITVASGAQGEVIILGECGGRYRFDVYKRNGEFLNSFNDAVIGSASHVTSTYDGQVMVADTKYDRVCILEFDSWGIQLKNFKVRGFPKGGIVFNPATGHVIVTSSPRDESAENAQIEVYTTNGEFAHVIALDAGATDEIGGISVTSDGRIVVVNEEERKIHVL